MNADKRRSTTEASKVWRSICLHLRSSALPTVLFLGTFLLSAFLLTKLSPPSQEAPRLQWMPAFDVPGDDSFFTYSASDELSHLALYHDFGESIANARDADILFLGNSRMPLGLREEAIVAAAEEQGVKVFSLAAGHSERLEFGLELIRKHDLRPKVVVAVGGPNFYDAGMSERAIAVAGLTRWQAWRDWFEARWAWSFQRLLHSWIPRLDWFDQDLTSSWIIYRSSRTGWWRPVVEPKRGRPVEVVRERRNYEATLPLARELDRELVARDALLVLAMTPYLRTQSGHLPYLSDELGAPVVLPGFDGLETNDGSHLDRDSGRRYARAFWDELVAVPEVREKLGLAVAAPSTSRVDRKTLADTRAAVLEMRAMLEKYYGGPEILRKTWYLQPDDLRYQQGVAYLAEKVARALVWRDRFAIGSIGSSVVAAGDNCRFDSYQSQLERLMAPVWGAAGVEFEVRNTGQGGTWGDSFINQVWCLRTLVGDDVDMTQYSWTYFEAGHSDQELAQYHELFYRWSLLMERGPVPQLIYTHDCSQLRKQDERLLDLYGRFGANILCMERGIKTAGYPGKQWKVVGDTIHDTTRYGEAPEVSEERRNSLGVVFRNWHPGPLLFQTTADAIAYSLSDAILLALDRLAAEPQPTVRWPRRPRLMAKQELPPPSACPVEWCGQEAPQCLDYEEPTFGEQHFRRLETHDPANRHRALSKPSDAEWELWAQAPGHGGVPVPERAMPECVHPERGGGLIAPKSKQASWLTFELPNLRLGFVAVCCASKKCGEQMLDAGAEFLLDGKPPAAVARPMRGGKCVEVQPRFDSGKRKRTTQLGIRIPARDQPLPAITHVIGL